MKSVTPTNLKHTSYYKFKYNSGNSLESFYFSPSFQSTIALQASQYGSVTSQQMEACSMAMRSKLSLCGKQKSSSTQDLDLILQSRLFAYCPITRKAMSVRMGKGKGKMHRWVSPVSKGQILYETRSKLYDFWVISAFEQGSPKLPMKVRVVSCMY